MKANQSSQTKLESLKSDSDIELYTQRYHTAKDLIKRLSDYVNEGGMATSSVNEEVEGFFQERYNQALKEIKNEVYKQS